MTADSKVYQLYCEIINDIYSNADDVDEAFNTISKLSDLVEMLDPIKCHCSPDAKADRDQAHDFVYFPNECE